MNGLGVPSQLNFPHPPAGDWL